MSESQLRAICPTYFRAAGRAQNNRAVMENIPQPLGAPSPLPRLKLLGPVSLPSCCGTTEPLVLQPIATLPPPGTHSVPLWLVWLSLRTPVLPGRSSGPHALVTGSLTRWLIFHLQTWGLLTSLNPESGLSQAQPGAATYGHNALVPTIAKTSKCPVSLDLGHPGPAQVHLAPRQRKPLPLCSLPQALPHTAPLGSGHLAVPPRLVDGPAPSVSKGCLRGAPFTPALAQEPS